ncbi:MAG: DUF1326 domain-containing protein [Planctomycetes bacterium]|nr:DUF1326 domain-containing protein [Planctomycetota bacterium]
MKPLAFVLAAMVAAPAGAQEKSKTPYTLKGEEIEGCSCDTYCPCVWKKDATFEQCRATFVFRVSEGTVGKTDLRGVSFAVVVTKSGKNIVKEMGRWEGVVYVDEKAAKEQKDAVVAFLSSRWGAGFAKLDVRSVPIEFKSAAETKEATLGGVGRLKIRALKGQNGKVPVIENPPFALIDKLYCAQAETHTYDDGKDKWDFSGQNAFYGPFEYHSE